MHGAGHSASHDLCAHGVRGQQQHHHHPLPGVQALQQCWLVHHVGPVYRGHGSEMTGKYLQPKYLDISNLTEKLWTDNIRHLRCSHLHDWTFCCRPGEACSSYEY